MAPGDSRNERSRSATQDRKKSVVSSRSRSFDADTRSRSTKKTRDSSQGPKDQYNNAKRPPECVCGPNIYGALLGPTVDEQILAGLSALFQMCDECPEELKDSDKPKPKPEPEPLPEPSRSGDTTVLSAQSPTLESSSRGPSGETIETDKSSVSSKDAEASTESRTTRESSIVTVDAYSTSSQTTPPATLDSESAEIETNVKSFSTTSSESQTISEEACLCRAMRHMCPCTGSSGKINGFQPPVMICVPALPTNQSPEKQLVPQLAPCCIPQPPQPEASHPVPDSGHSVRYDESTGKRHHDHESSDHHSRHHTPSDHSKHSHEKDHSHHSEHHHPPSIHSRTSRSSRKHKDSDHHDKSSHHSRHHEPSVRSRSSHESHHSKHHKDSHHSRHGSDHRSEHRPHSSHESDHHRHREPPHHSHSSHESHHGGSHHSAHRSRSPHDHRPHKSKHELRHHPRYDRSYERDYPCSFFPGREKLELGTEHDIGPCCPCHASATSSSSSGRKKVDSSTSSSAGFKIKISRNCGCQSESENTKESSTSCTSITVCRPSRSKHRKNGLKQVDCGCKKSKIQTAIKKGPSCGCNSSNTTTTDTITSESAGSQNSDVRYAITKITKFASYTTFEVMKSTRKQPKTIPTKLEGVFVLRNKKVN